MGGTEAQEKPHLLERVSRSRAAKKIEQGSPPAFLERRELREGKASRNLQRQSIWPEKRLLSTPEGATNARERGRSAQDLESVGSGKREKEARKVACTTAEMLQYQEKVTF